MKIHIIYIKVNCFYEQTSIRKPFQKVLEDCFKSFLTDETICFVALSFRSHLDKLQKIGAQCKTGVNLGYLVA